jgi:hypothetical protein
MVMDMALEEDSSESDGEGGSGSGDGNGGVTPRGGAGGESVAGTGTGAAPGFFHWDIPAAAEAPRQADGAEKDEKERAEVAEKTEGEAEAPRRSVDSVGSETVSERPVDDVAGAKKDVEKAQEEEADADVPKKGTGNLMKDVRADQNQGAMEFDMSNFF